MAAKLRLFGFYLVLAEKALGFCAPEAAFNHLIIFSNSFKVTLAVFLWPLFFRG
jgi:hypothetical protein